MLVTVIILAALMAGMGVLILLGKGDNLIAGYNTASPEERAKVDIKKLRLLIGVFLIVLAPTMFFLTTGHSMANSLAFASVLTFLCIVVLILANTWAKKK